MTEVLTNVENIIDNYEDKKQEKIDTKIEILLMVYKLKKMIKTDRAQQLIKENIIKDKKINDGKDTIKGTRITPNDIGRIITNNSGITLEKIFDEFPSLESKKQILAGVFVFMKENITWRKALFNK